MSYLISFTVGTRVGTWPRIFDDIVSHDLPRVCDLDRVRKLIAKETQMKYQVAEFAPEDVTILNIMELRE